MINSPPFRIVIITVFEFRIRMELYLEEQEERERQRELVSWAQDAAAWENIFALI